MGFYRYVFAADVTKCALNVVYVPIIPCFLLIYRYALAKNRLKLAKMGVIMVFGALIIGVYETFT